MEIQQQLPVFVRRSILNRFDLMPPRGSSFEPPDSARSYAPSSSSSRRSDRSSGSYDPIKGSSTGICRHIVNDNRVRNRQSIFVCVLSCSSSKWISHAAVDNGRLPTAAIELPFTIDSASSTARAPTAAAAAAETERRVWSTRGQHSISHTRS